MAENKNDQTTSGWTPEKRARSTANLVAFTGEEGRKRASELGKRSGEARRAKKAQREEADREARLRVSFGTLYSAQVEADVPWTSRIQAAIALLNRELGTPAQTIETTQKVSPYANMTAEELRAKLRSLPPPTGTEG
jgi:hypothetical protein